MNRRPTGITVLAIIDAISVAIAIPLMLFLTFFSTGDPQLDLYLPQFKLLYVGALLIGVVLSAVRGWAFWTLQPWGRNLGIALAIMGLLGFPVGTIVNALLLWYYSQPHVKAAFASGPIPFTLSKGADGPGAGPGNEIIRTAPPRKPIQRPMASAWLVDEDGAGNWQLNRGDTRLGRGADNDIDLADPSVSREHALIRETDGRYTLYDRASTHGTYVNEVRATGPVLLQHGDVIRLGDTSARLIYRE